MTAVAPACVPINAALQESLTRGEAAEQIFKQLVRLCMGTIIAHATREQDMCEHWDYLVRFNIKAYKVEVKARKSLARGTCPQDDLVCCELHGSSPRNEGWLFNGHADLIAFQVDEGFILVWRKKLCDYLNTHVDRSKVANSSRAAVNGAVYNRRDSELVTWVPMAVLAQPGLMAAMLR